MSLSLIFNALWFTGVVCALSAQVKVLQVCVFSPASGYIGKKTHTHSHICIQSKGLQLFILTERIVVDYGYFFNGRTRHIG